MDRIVERFADLDAREAALRESVKSMVKDAVRAERARRAELDVTSAVVETHPLRRGFHYSKAHGRSGMGEEDEYGLLPASVGLEDLARVHLVRRGEVVGSVDADRIEEAVERFAEAAPCPVP